MSMEPQCCEKAKEHIEFRIFGVGDSGFVLYHDEFFVRLTYCPFCAAELSTEPFRLGGGPYRICFDIDGVLAVEEGVYEDRAVYPEALSRLKRLAEAGHTLIYCTARYMRHHMGDQAAAVSSGWLELKNWLDKYGFPPGEIYLGKPSADFYADDKAALIRSGRGSTDWDRFFAQIGMKE